MRRGSAIGTKIARAAGVDAPLRPAYVHCTERQLQQRVDGFRSSNGSCLKTDCAPTTVAPHRFIADSIRMSYRRSSCAAHAFVRARPCRARGEFKTCADCPLWASAHSSNNNCSRATATRRSRRGSQRNTETSTRSGPGTGGGFARLSGRLRQTLADERLPCVGDWVILKASPRLIASAAIERVLARRSAFTRGVAGRQSGAQAAAANIELVFVVCGLDGDFNLHRIERFVARIWASGAQPFVVAQQGGRERQPPPPAPRKWEGDARAFPSW